MSKVSGATLEDVAKAAGLDLANAKEALAKLDASFGGSHGDIPDPALRQWVNAHFYGETATRFFVALGKAWEQEIASGLPPERKKERELTPEQWVEQRDKKLKQSTPNKE